MEVDPQHITRDYMRRHVTALFSCSLLCLSHPTLASLGTLPPPHLLGSIPLTGTARPAPRLTMSTPLPPPAVTNATPVLPTPGSTHPPIPSSSGLTLSDTAEPFPQKLVEKVTSGQFVEMSELLADNINLLQYMQSMQGTFPVQMLGPSRPKLREVNSLPTWLYCFLGYTAIYTTDKRTRDHLAYARLIIREAQRHGGRGWLDYDRAFRKQAAADPQLRWNTLLPGLQASTIVGQPTTLTGQPTPLFCTLCRGVDHTRVECALAYIYSPPPTPSIPAIQTRSTNFRSPGRSNICRSWNRGQCVFPNTCTYKHVCVTCQLPHRAKDCPRTPEDSFYKRLRTRIQTAPPPTHLAPRQ